MKNDKSYKFVALVVFVLEAGLEPAQPQWPKDFKSFVSTIPPFEQPVSDRKDKVFLFILQIFYNLHSQIML